MPVVVHGSRPLRAESEGHDPRRHLRLSNNLWQSHRRTSKFPAYCGNSASIWSCAHGLGYRLRTAEISAVTSYRWTGHRRTATAVNPSPDQSSAPPVPATLFRSEEHTSELQSRGHIVCRLL